MAEQYTVPLQQHFVRNSLKKGAEINSETITAGASVMESRLEATFAKSNSFPV